MTMPEPRPTPDLPEPGPDMPDEPPMEVPPMREPDWTPPGADEPPLRMPDENPDVETEL